MNMPSHIRYGFSVESKGTTPKIIHQAHGRNIVELTQAEQRDSLVNHPPDADGVVTRLSGVPLYVFTADCVPVLLFSEDPEAPIAAIHSGWRSTKDRIIPLALERYYANPARCHAIVGPSILGCCFEVKDDFVEAFRSAGNPVDRFVEARDGKFFCHLVKFIVETQLNALPSHQIDLSRNTCTVCSVPKLPSFRRDGHTRIQIRAWIEKLCP